MARQRRLQDPEGLYFVTSVTFRRRRWFADEQRINMLAEQWRHYEARYGFRLHAYSIMPDRQGDAWDEGIRDEAMYWQKVAYTLFNPWRDELVKSPLELTCRSNIAMWIADHGEEFMLDLLAKHKRLLE